VRIFSLVLAVAVLAPGLVESAVTDPVVTVTFVDAGHFRDAAFDRERQTDPAVVDGIRKHLEKLGAKYLAPGEKLDMQILDIDLAGRLEPWHSINGGVRYMRDITWPRMKLRYSLIPEPSGTVSREETLTDLNYLNHLSGQYFSNDRLRYEKQMLDDWFKARFVDRRTTN
jgi:hypothetical protein